MNKKVVIYARVSSNTQDNKRQIQELKQHCTLHGLELVKVFEEKISGAKKTKDRPVFSQMLGFALENGIHSVLCWELSRIGRNVVEVLTAINTLTENGVNLYIHNYNLNTLDNKGGKDILSGFLIQILTSVAEMERTAIKQRLDSGLKKYRAEGGRMGRTKGTVLTDSEFLDKHKDVVKYLNKGFSIRQAAKQTDKNPSTIQKVRRLINQ